MRLRHRPDLMCGAFETPRQIYILGQADVSTGNAACAEEFLPYFNRCMAGQSTKGESLRDQQVRYKISVSRIDP